MVTKPFELPQYIFVIPVLEHSSNKPQNLDTSRNQISESFPDNYT